jgi:hypothetical protein
MCRSFLLQGFFGATLELVPLATSFWSPRSRIALVGAGSLPVSTASSMRGYPVFVKCFASFVFNLTSVNLVYVPCEVSADLLLFAQ